MNSGSFADAYRTAKPHNRYDPDDNRREILDDTSEWSFLYAELLKKALLGADLGSEANELNIRYRSWVLGTYQRKYATVMQELNEVNEADEAEILCVNNFLSKDSFNTMNACMMELWPYAVSDTRVPRKLIELVKLNLAMSGVDAPKRLAELHEKGELLDLNGHVPRYISEQAGPTTETDAAIAALGLSRLNPDIVTLPSPSYFEHSFERSRNSDLIAVNHRESRVRGLQVKTQVTQADREQYEPSLITLIDGSSDLDNTVSLRIPGKTAHRVVQWPGLISAHTLLEHKQPFRAGYETGKNVTFTGWHQAIVKAKLEARGCTMRTKSSTIKAGAIVSSRVLHDLQQ